MPLARILDKLRHVARLRRADRDHAMGKRGEDLAHRYLARRGFLVVARNYRTLSNTGEADIVAWDGAALAFVEVKSRTSDEFGSPERQIDVEKRRNLARAAREYCRRSGADWDAVRFDLVTVLLGDKPAIGHIKDAWPRPR